MPPAALVSTTVVTPKAAQHAHGKSGFFRLVAFVGMHAALHHDDRCSGPDDAGDQAAAMADYRGPGKVGNFRVGDGDRLFDTVCERAQARAQHHRYARCATPSLARRKAAASSAFSKLTLRF